MFFGALAIPSVALVAFLLPQLDFFVSGLVSCVSALSILVVGSTFSAKTSPPVTFFLLSARICRNLVNTSIVSVSVCLAPD